MMMIAFITIKSSLVPLIEGLCANIHCVPLEIINCLEWPHSVFVKHFYYTSNRSRSIRVRFSHSWADPPIVRVGLSPISLRFLSQIWVSDVTFVTFSGDKKCAALHLSHFWKECDALAHEFFFLTCHIFGHILFEKRHILAPLVQKFLNGKKCDDSAGTETCFSLLVSDLSLITKASSGKAI